MRNRVKVGEKGRHMTIPEGWELVTSGPIEKGDKIADIVRHVWDAAEDEGWVDIDVLEITSGAIIRKVSCIK